MNKNKMSSRPLINKGIDTFISEAEKFPEGTKVEDVKTNLPWQDAKVREDVIRSINLRMSEPYLLKLKYIAEHTKYSQQSFIRESIEKIIDKKINDLLDGVI